MTKKFEVVLNEVHTYKIVVEADNESEAGRLAYESDKYCQSTSDEIDTTTGSIAEVEESTELTE